MKKILTPIQSRVLELLRQCVEQGEPTPTYRDLCTRFGWASTGTVRDHLRALARKGYIELSGGRARNLRVISEKPSVVNLPVVGRIIAGMPLLSEENIQGTIPVPSEWLSKGTHFVLRVIGDSMHEAGILEGDYVVVRKECAAQKGDVVVAALEGETTLKRLNIINGSLVLTADNPNYPPIYFRTESSVIQGIVVGLLRTYVTRVKHRNSAVKERQASLPTRSVYENRT